MKRSILLFTGLLLASATQAQITLNSSDYPTSVIGTDSLKTTTAASTFPTLSVGANKTWDLSTVTDSAAVLYAYRVGADTSSCEFADSVTYSFSTAAYQGNVQSIINSTGLIQYGIFIPAATQTVSGATIDILDQHTIFSSPYTVIKFPATMGSNWASNYQSNFNVTVTYVPILTNSPGTAQSNVTETDTVTGWGKMRIKDMSGSPSLYFDVLQVKTVTTTITTLSGSLGTLATAASISNPDTTTTYAQDYYRSNEVTPFAHVVYTDGTYSTPANATTHTQRLLNNSVPTVINNSGVNIYPNPVSGNIVSIDLPATGGAWAYELIDMSGKIVASAPLQVNGRSTQLSLPVSVTAGIYYIRLNNNGSEVCVRSIEVVK